ncbi:hsp70 nucleotide exchange factor fes1, partial [Cladochytrium tenue]
DPKWVDVILGKSDAVRMRDAVATIADASLPTEDRLAAFDELELLVESIDNANDLRPLGLWAPIVAVLRTDPDAELRAFAAWVLGTAVQNNPRAQKDFLETPGALDALSAALATESNAEVLAKAMTLLSGLLRHNADAAAVLAGLRSSDATAAGQTANGGTLGALARVLAWRPASGGARVATKVRRRAAFLLGNLVAGEEVPRAVAEAIVAGAGEWAPAVVMWLQEDLDAGDDSDADLVEK